MITPLFGQTTNGWILSNTTLICLWSILDTFVSCMSNTVTFFSLQQILEAQCWYLLSLDSSTSLFAIGASPACSTSPVSSDLPDSITNHWQLCHHQEARVLQHLNHLYFGDNYSTLFTFFRAISWLLSPPGLQFFILGNILSSLAAESDLWLNHDST